MSFCGICTNKQFVELVEHPDPTRNFHLEGADADLKIPKRKFLCPACSVVAHKEATQQALKAENS